MPKNYLKKIKNDSWPFLALFSTNIWYGLTFPLMAILNGLGQGEYQAALGSGLASDNLWFSTYLTFAFLSSRYLFALFGLLLLGLFFGIRNFRIAKANFLKGRLSDYSIS